MMPTRKRTVRNAALWSVALAFGLIGLIVVVSAWGQTPAGASIIENPGALIGLVITGLGSIMAIILPAALRFEKNSEELKEQVKNDHKKTDGTPLLLRDDLDDKHDVVLSRIDSLQNNMEARFRLLDDNVENIEGGVQLAIQLSQANASDVRGMRRDMGRITDDIRENTRETARIGKLATGLNRTVTTLEGEVSTIKEAIHKHNPKETS